MNEYGKKVAKKMEDYMSNPDSVSEEINDIQNALHGVDVRGALAAGVKKSFSKSESAEGISKNTEQRQDAVEQQFDDVLNEWTSDKPISNEETIAARTNRETGENHQTLGQRLDAENKKVTAQLADNAEVIHNNKLELLEKLTQLKSDVTLTVGGSGDFTSLNDAINHLTKYQPLYKKDGYNVEVKLLSGFIMKEQLIVKGMNLGWITITSEDEEVVIDRQSLQKDPEDIFTTKTAFLGYSSATLPNIKTIFNMNDTGDITNTRVFGLRGNSFLHIHPHCGAKGNASRLISITHASSCLATHGIFSDCSNGIGVRVSNSSIFQAEYAEIARNRVNLAVATAMVNVDYATLTDALEDGLRATTGPNIISASHADVSRAGRYGLHVLHAGDVGFRNGKANDCGEIGIYIEGGGSVYASGANVNRCKGNIQVLSGRLNFDRGFANDSLSYGMLTLNANVTARHAQIKNSNTLACQITSGSNIDLYNADITGARQYGLLCTASYVNAELIKALMGDANSHKDIAISKGGIVVAHGSIGGVSDKINTLTWKGIIFKE